eukprot:TRINITY_DN20302_c0_g1_i1.p2 TRINITY_DN20302_c0_g1~~TRINITY_DN20302_c0_g1_i1.p2  ORF type:complete len:371 (+),score=124.47 TRINITY_DN20302_c0_g1_i1:41-1114(+)
MAEVRLVTARRSAAPQPAPPLPGSPHLPGGRPLTCWQKGSCAAAALVALVLVAPRWPPPPDRRAAADAGPWREDARQGVQAAPGLVMPRIIYGTAWKKERTAALVAQAVRIGFRGIDTACQPRHYNESGVGAGMGAARADLYVQTKFTPPSGQDPDRTPYDRTAAVEEQVAQSWAASVRNLGSAPDVWIMHSPYPQLADTVRAWRAMERVAAAQPKPPALGMSNMASAADFAALHQAAERKPVVLQNRFVADFGYDADLRRLLSRLRVRYQSFWTLTGNPAAVGSAPVAAEARRRGRTPQQVFLRYCVDRGIVPLMGAKRAVHVAAALQLLEDQPLSDPVLEAIDSVLAAEAARKRR